MERFIPVLSRGEIALVRHIYHFQLTLESQEETLWPYIAFISVYKWSPISRVLQLVILTDIMEFSLIAVRYLLKML